MLSQKFRTHATAGNLNNHIGVPLTILSAQPGTQVAVIEMGANHQKEIEFLCSIAQPTLGMITNVGKAHLEGFGGAEGVKKGKGELYDYLDSTQGTAFVNHNSTVLMDMVASRNIARVLYYGQAAGDDVSGRVVQNAPFLSIVYQTKNGTEQTLQTNLTGTYNLDNILAAICIGNYLVLSTDHINKGISSYQPVNNRSQINKTAWNTIIADYYNANPSSMQAALENIGKLAAENKIAILGDMFELGDESAVEHKAIIELALNTGLQQCIFIGNAFYAYKNNFTGAAFYASTDDAIAALTLKPIKNATILVKGSRGMALEKLSICL